MKPAPLARERDAVALRRTWAQDDVVPELECPRCDVADEFSLDVLQRDRPAAVASVEPLLGVGSVVVLGDDVGLDRLRRLAMRHKLPIDDLLTELARDLTSEDHYDDAVMVGIQWQN